MTLVRKLRVHPCSKSLLEVESKEHCVCVWQILEAASEAVHWRLCSFAEVSLRQPDVLLAKWQRRLGNITDESKQVTG
jgi:hypothetical protein